MIDVLVTNSNNLNIMEVSLYVYDLSKGLARQWSLPLTGIQIDAIYHTSLVFGGTEYFFGSGVQRTIPGSTHHGQPMQVIHQGTTEIPMSVIEEYMESLAEIYTAESYDLFLHNCNNFTQDLSIFLTGSEIPDHIRKLPQKVLDTPFGQMLRPQIDKAMRGITQGDQSVTPAVGSNLSQPTTPDTASHQNGVKGSRQIPEDFQHIVHSVTSSQELEKLLKAAEKSCAVIFFTSATCAPCKIVYPTYDSLAAEAGSKAVLIKVDINQAHEIGMKYDVRATPTFITLLKGVQENRWTGSSPSELEGNMRLLIQMAWPIHPHRNIPAPTFSRKVDQYVMYQNLPPLEKLVAKLGDTAKHPALTGLISFIKARNTDGAAEAPLPDLPTFSKYMQSDQSALDQGSTFALVDLIRIAFLDTRLSGYFATETSHSTIRAILSGMADLPNAAYNLQVVTLQLLCNLFSSHLYPPRIVEDASFLTTVLEPVQSSLTSSKASKTRAISAAFVYNLASYNHNFRVDDRPDTLSETVQTELVAALVEAIDKESESAEALHGELAALGMLLYMAPVDGEVLQLCQAMNARDILKSKGEVATLKGEKLIGEVGELFSI